MWVYLSFIFQHLIFHLQYNLLYMNLSLILWVVHSVFFYFLSYSLDYLQKETSYPFFFTSIRPERVLLISCIRTVLYPNKPLVGTAFYRYNWTQKEIPSADFYALLRGYMFYTIRSIGLVNNTPIENILLILLYLGLTCYYDGYGEMISRFHEILCICKSPVLWSLYFEVIWNCPGVHLNKRYLSSVASMIKDKKVYLSEYALIE